MTKNVLHESYWPTVKDALLDGLTGRKREVTGVLLENYRRAGVTDNSGMLVENAGITSTTSGNIAQLNKVMLPIIRRVMPTVIANELVGVQPMQGPIGQISTLRVRYAETFGAPAGTVAGTEALSPFDIARFYSGNGNSTTPGAAATATLEGTAGKKLKVEVVKETVEAKTRRLSADWTFEAQQDGQAQYGIDIEAEIMSALATELTAEIDQEILQSLRRLPGAASFTYDQNNLSGAAVSVVDEHAAFAVMVNRAAQLIAQRTRRGAGNWIVVSPVVLSILQSARASAFVRTTEGTFEASTNVKFAGTLNGTIRVYVDTYAADNEVALLGYKGSDTDAAAFFCPYIPLMSSGVVINAQNFQPTTSFLTRYGYLELTNTASSFGNAADFVASIAVANPRFA